MTTIHISPTEHSSLKPLPTLPQRLPIVSGKWHPPLHPVQTSHAWLQGEPRRSRAVHPARPGVCQTRTKIDVHGSQTLTVVLQSQHCFCTSEKKQKKTFWCYASFLCTGIAVVKIAQICDLQWVYSMFGAISFCQNCCLWQNLTWPQPKCWSQ